LLIYICVCTRVTRKKCPRSSGVTCSAPPMAKNGQPPCHQNIKWQQILWSSPVRWFAMVWPQLNFFSLFFSGIALDQLKLNFVLQLCFCFNSNPYSFYYFLFFNLFYWFIFLILSLSIWFYLIFISNLMYILFIAISFYIPFF
jgi:hypothetical protein